MLRPVFHLQGTKDLLPRGPDSLSWLFSVLKVLTFAQKIWTLRAEQRPGIKGVTGEGNWKEWSCCSTFCPEERNFKYLPNYMGKIVGEDMVSTFPGCGTLSIRPCVRGCAWCYMPVTWKAHIGAKWWLAALFQPGKRHFVVSQLERIEAELLKLLVDRIVSLCDSQKPSANVQIGARELTSPGPAS